MINFAYHLGGENLRFPFFTLLALVFSALPASAQDKSILVQSTTSTQNSGLYDYLLPLFTNDTGISVNVVAVGTGQAIRNASNGDADVLLVHAKASEEAFIADGNGVKRFDLMYNDFVIIGPKNDPAGLSGAKDIQTSLKLIADQNVIFVSRGDDSGTHMKELSLWKTAIGNTPKGANYRETGSGMGATLRVAVEMGAYTMSDRATWIAYADKQDAKIAFDGDPALFNQYGIIAINPDKHPHVKWADAQVFIDWMLAEKGQNLIAEYTVADQQLFFPNAQH